MISGNAHKIGDVAAILATSIRALRYYEEEGLVTPIRTDGGTRLYSNNHIDRLRAILNLTKTGYSIEAIKSLSQLREKHRTGDKSQKAISDQLDEWLAGIDSHIHQLKLLAHEIMMAKQTLQKCSGCNNQPSSKGCPSCPVKNHLVDIELLNLIWDQESGR